MRNALVVLVPVCIGLTSGFIVPPSTQEVFGDIYNNNRNGLETKNVLRRESNPKSNPIILADCNTSNFSEKNAKEILEKEIYEHASSKDFNLTERSFIYIKKRFKKPFKDYFYFKPDEYAKNNTSTNLTADKLQDIPQPVKVGFVERNILNTYNILNPCTPKSHPHNHDDNNEGYGTYEFKSDSTIQQKVDSKEQKSFKMKVANDELVQLGSREDIVQVQEGGGRNDEDIDYGEILNNLVKKPLEDLPPLKLNNPITQVGFHYCRDCVEKERPKVYKIKCVS